MSSGEMTRVYEMERNCVDCIRTYMHTRVHNIYIYIFIRITNSWRYPRTVFSLVAAGKFSQRTRKKDFTNDRNKLLRSRSNNGDRGFAVVSRSKRRIGRNKSRNNSIEQSCLGNWIITGEEYK